jgi:hypothetical protein
VTGISANVALDSGFSAAVNYSMIDTDGTVNGDGGTHMGIGAATRSTPSPCTPTTVVTTGTPAHSQLTRRLRPVGSLRLRWWPVGALGYGWGDANNTAVGTVPARRSALPAPGRFGLNMSF